jgi:hypothetical protein
MTSNQLELAAILISFGLLQYGMKPCHILAQGLIALSPSLAAIEAESNF